MQLVTASNFFRTKQFITDLVSKISDINVPVINRILRQRFIGSEVESISCTKINDSMISVRITLRDAVTVFQVKVNGKEG